MTADDPLSKCAFDNVINENLGGIHTYSLLQFGYIASTKAALPIGSGIFT